MAMKSGGFSRKSKVASEIPSSSLADIAFLLLIFFMVTTVFRNDRDRPIEWPSAAAAMKTDEKVKNILNVWIERSGAVFINDQQIPMTQVSDLVGPLYAQSEQRLVISIRSDREVPYSVTDDLLSELVSANVLRVVFATELEQRVTGERR